MRPSDGRDRCDVSISRAIRLAMDFGGFGDGNQKDGRAGDKW